MKICNLIIRNNFQTTNLDGDDEFYSSPIQRIMLWRGSSQHRSALLVCCYPYMIMIFRVTKAVLLRYYKNNLNIPILTNMFKLKNRSSGYRTGCLTDIRFYRRNLHLISQHLSNYRKSQWITTNAIKNIFS